MQNKIREMTLTVEDTAGMRRSARLSFDEQMGLARRTNGAAGVRVGNNQVSEIRTGSLGGLGDLVMVVQ